MSRHWARLEPASRSRVSIGCSWYCENCGECVHVLLVKNPEHEHAGYYDYCSAHLYVEITAHCVSFLE